MVWTKNASETSVIDDLTDDDANEKCDDGQLLAFLFLSLSFSITVAMMKDDILHNCTS